MIILGIITILWGSVGGFDWVSDCWSCYDSDYIKEIARLTELNKDYLEFLKLKENILSSRNYDIFEYKRQIKELIDLNSILKDNLSNAKTIIFSLEDQLYVDDNVVSEEISGDVSGDVSGDLDNK